MINKMANVGIPVISACVFFLILHHVQTMPLHASCKIDWQFSAKCDAVNNRIKLTIDRYSTTNCDGVGEKCLYTLKSQTASEIKAIHETPKKHYKDDLTFTFTQTADLCLVHGFSTSETWYALLDFGTNYCNLENIITGADLNRDPAYKETTSNSVCTQFSSANCTIY